MVVLIYQRNVVSTEPYPRNCRNAARKRRKQAEEKARSLLLFKPEAVPLQGFFVHSTVAHRPNIWHRETIDPCCLEHVSCGGVYSVEAEDQGWDRHETHDKEGHGRALEEFKVQPGIAVVEVLEGRGRRFEEISRAPLEAGLKSSFLGAREVGLCPGRRFVVLAQALEVVVPVEVLELVPCLFVG